MIEQSFYTLEELADRWNNLFNLDVNPRKLIHLAIQQKFDIDVSIARLNSYLPPPLVEPHSHIRQKYSIEVVDFSVPNPFFAAQFTFEKPFEPIALKSLAKIEAILPADKSESFCIKALDLKDTRTKTNHSRRLGVCFSGRYSKDFEVSLRMDLDCLYVSQLSARLYEDELIKESEYSKHELSGTREQTYLAIIAALLDKALSASSSPMTQDSIAHDIESAYGHANNGLSHSQLTKIFAKAKKALSEKAKK